MTALADRIDRLVSGIGRIAAWLILVVVLLQFALVVARYLFGLGSIWLSNLRQGNVWRLDPRRVQATLE